jgi:hypothetical protein
MLAAVAMNRACAVRSIAGSFASICLASSCGGAPPALQAPAAQVGAVAVRAASPPPDLAAVPGPPALVVSGRFARPGTSLSLVRGWSKLPMPQAEEVTEVITGEALGPLVDLEQSIDFAVAVVGSGPRMRDRSAVSAALKDVERAKATLSERYKLVPAGNGAFLIQGLGGRTHHDGDEQDDGEDDRRACEIAPAYGAAPVRLVCGGNSKALSELAPWLTRTLPRSAAVDDLEVEVRMAPLRATISQDRRVVSVVLAALLAERFGLSSARQLASSVAADMADFALDIDTLSLGVRMNETAATAALTFKLSGMTSALAHVLATRPKETPAVPAAFWQLPHDADFAFFAPGIDDSRLLSQWRDPVLRAIADELSGAGVAEADRKAIVEALGKLVPSVPMSYASGLDPDAVRKGVAAESSLGDGTSPADRAEAKRASIEALFGWHLLAVEEPAGQLNAALKDLAGAWGRPGVAEAYRTRAKDRALPVLRSAPLTKGVAAAPGSQHYVLEVHPASAASVAGSVAGAANARTATKPLAIHLLVAADGSRTWMAIGGNEGAAASKLARAIGNSGDRLGGQPELDALKAATGLGGFVTMRALLEEAQAPPLLSSASTYPVAAALGEAASLPHGGMVRMPFYWRIEPVVPAPPAQAGAVAGVSLVVPRGAIEDLVTTIVRRGGF